MFSYLTSRTAKSLKNSQLLKIQLFYKSQNYFAYASRDCFQMLNIRRHPTKDEIISAYNAKLNEIYSKAKPAEENEQVQQLNEAKDEALKSIELLKGQQTAQASLANNIYNHQESPQQKTQEYVQQSFSNTQPRRGWFRQMLSASNFGQQAGQEEKKWGMQLFFLGAVGVAGICYLIGSNLTDKSGYNQDKIGHRTLNTVKDLDIAKEQYKDYKDYKKQLKSDFQQMKENPDYQQAHEGHESKSQFEREFEEYKEKTSPGIFGTKIE